MIDGDTIEIDNKMIRLDGIDAPEKGQPCRRNDLLHDYGTSSKKHLEFILTGTKIECTRKGKDKWGRIIRKCAADGDDIGLTNG